MSDPFTGSHWAEGYDEEVKEGWSDSEESDELTSSGEDEEVATPSSKVMGTSVTAPRRRDDENREQEERRMLDAKATLARFRKAAYWRTGGEEMHTIKGDVHGWRQLTTSTSLVTLT